MIKPQQIIETTIVFSLVALCFAGKGVLDSFGYIMGTEATSAYTKIHPISYLLFGLLALKLITLDLKLLKTLFFNKSVLFYLISVFGLLGYLIISDNASSMSFIIDTLLIPVLFFVYFKTTSKEAQQRAIDFAIFFILINSSIAIFERLQATNLFPITYTYGEVFRSTALLGHPLNNALITLVFVLLILVININPIKKNTCLSILLLSLMCYGARGCLFAAVIGIFLLYVIPAIFSQNAYFKGSKLVSITLIFLGGIVLAIMLFYSSFGERLVDVSFFDDSANTRTQALDLINFNSLSDYFWSMPQNEIDLLTFHFKIGIIENFLVVWILKFGLIFSGIILVTLFNFLYTNFRESNKIIGIIILLLFLGAAVTNNSLATNTSALLLFVNLFLLQSEKYSLIFSPIVKKTTLEKLPLQTFPSLSPKY